VGLFLAALDNLSGGPSPSDAALMEQLARRVPEALEQLYDRHARAWLLTMARNRALDHLRLKREKQRRREDAFDVIEPRDVRAPNPEAVIDQRILTERVRAVMTELPAAQRKALELAYFDGMTHSEIAEAMREPLGTVKSWIRNGLIHLREVLEQTS
jgi:RNA polymerase sigma-70 factor (ECF subfamily)